MTITRAHTLGSRTFTHGISRMPGYALNVCFKRPSRVPWRVKEWSLTSSTSRLLYPGSVKSGRAGVGAEGSGRRMARPLRHIQGEHKTGSRPLHGGATARFYGATTSAARCVADRRRGGRRVLRVAI